MKLLFLYDIEKEFVNLWNGLRSRNHPKDELPSIVQEMLQKGVNLEDKEEVKNFFKNKIQELKFNPGLAIQKIKQKWDLIQEEAIDRLDKLFEGKLLFDITAYLSLNERCSYNYKEKYFFIYAYAKNTNLIILHELLHFYTLTFIAPIFKENKIPKEKFYDFNEAITFILNTNFSDLLEGDKDLGYEKQKQLRSLLEKQWSSCKTIKNPSHYAIKIFSM
jgi:DNA-binding Lrp family transcriptional regulator